MAGAGGGAAMINERVKRETVNGGISIRHKFHRADLTAAAVRTAADSLRGTWWQVLKA